MSAPSPQKLAAEQLYAGEGSPGCVRVPLCLASAARPRPHTRPRKRSVPPCNPSTRLPVPAGSSYGTLPAVNAAPGKSQAAPRPSRQRYKATNGLTSIVRYG